MEQTKMEKFQHWMNELSFPIAFSLVAGIIRFLFSDKKSVLSFLRGVTVSCFAGAIVSMALQSYQFNDGMKGAIVGVSAFVADEILMVIIIVAKNFKDDPMSYVRDYLRRK